MLPHSSPREFGKYVLLRQIGRGGMADVYEAEHSVDTGISKRVALKLLLPGLKHRDRVIRSFVDEATIAARLAHPNIVQVFDFGEIEGTLFMAMEYVEGWDLRELIALLERRGERMPVEATIYVVHELALALDYIHSLADPVVHRDVTPHNVFVTRDGHVKLGDFGIAKWATREGYTETGQIKGKLSYLAPEQVTGDPVTPRTDIYAAGMILFELATGRRLLSGANEVQLIQNARAPEVILPSSLNPAAADLDELVLRALRPHPTMRLPSAALLQERLQALLQRRPFDARALSQLVLGLEREEQEEVVGPDGGTQTGTVTRPHSREREVERQVLPKKPTTTRPLPQARELEAQRPRGLRPNRLSLVLGLVGIGVVALLLTVWQAKQWLIGWGADRKPSPDLTFQRAAPRTDAGPTRSALPVEAPDVDEDAGATARPDVEPVDVRPDSRVVSRRRRPGRARARPASRRRSRPATRANARSPVPEPAPLPVRPPAPAPQTEVLRRRLKQTLERARAKGLFPGDDRAVDRALSAVRRAVGRDAVEAERRLQELERRVDSFRLDRRFANQKLARLERAIARAKLSDADRKQLTASAQRILRLIINDQLKEASTLITTQMRLLSRKAR